MIKNHIIGLKGNKISEAYMEITIPKIKEVTVNEEVIFWQGTTPETMPKDGPLKFTKVKHRTKGDVKSKKEPAIFSETEKCIWYSHLFLWEHLYRNKIDSWIFEHDVKFKKECILLPDVYNNDLVFGRYAGSAFCYYARHNNLSVLIDFVKSIKHNSQIDSFLYDFVHRDEYNGIKMPRLKCVELIYPIGQYRHLGNTIDHL